MFLLLCSSYFDCRPMYGLFAPVHKVNKLSATSTPSPMTRSLGSAGLRMSRERSGSQESVSSISSATSSASRPRVRLGVSGLGNSQVHAVLLMPYCVHIFQWLLGCSGARTSYTGSLFLSLMLP